MRSLKLRACAIGLGLLAACGEDKGLLDLTLTVDPQAPPPQAASIILFGSGDIRRGYAARFPPDGASSLRLQYPNLPARTILFTMQTLDSHGCVLGESSALFRVEIRAGAKATATTMIRRSAVPCGDAGVAPPSVDRDAAMADEVGPADVPIAPADGLLEMATPSLDGPASIDAPPGGIDASTSIDAREGVDGAKPDAPPSDPPGPEAPTTDTSPTTSTVDAGPDTPVPAFPRIVSFTASPCTISTGSSATLTAVFENATAASIDQWIGGVTSDNGVSTGPLTDTTTYKLTVSNAAGDSTSQTVTVTVVQLPSIVTFRARLPTIASGTLTELTSVFLSGTGSIDQGIGPVESGSPVATPVLFADTTYTLTVTNAAGDSTSRQATVTVSTAVGPGTFAATGSMVVPRSDHTATLLANGKVLIAGGVGADNTAVAELYDPASGTFSPTGSLPEARRGHTATLLRNGKVLIAGGYPPNRSPHYSDAVLYDPTTGRFAATGNLIQPRESHTATLLSDGRVLVAGGAGETGYLATAEVYDPAKGTFTASGQMSNPRMYFTANLLPDGQVLVAGGMNVTDVPPRGYVPTADLWNPGTGLFSSTGMLYYGRCSHTAVLLRTGHVLIVGGEGQGGATLAAETYDPATARFTTSSRMLHDGYRHTTTLLPNGNVLVTGGIGAVSSTEIYAGGFADGSLMLTGRERHAAALLQSGMVLIAGGSTSSSPGASHTGTAELYW